MPKPTQKQDRAARNLVRGMGRTEALIDAGYSLVTAKSQGPLIVRQKGTQQALYTHITEVASEPDVSAGIQERFVRRELFAGAIAESGLTKARYLELLGKDKRVGMFQPDVVVGVQVNLDSAQDLLAIPDTPEYQEPD